MSVAGYRLPVRKVMPYAIPARRKAASDPADMWAAGLAAVRQRLTQVLGCGEFLCANELAGADFDLCHIQFERLDFLRLAAPCETSFTIDRRRHLVCFCERGEARYTEDGETYLLNEERAAILAAPVRGRFVCAPGSCLIVVMLSEADFRREASSVLKGVSSAKLGMARSFSIAANPGRVFRDAAHMLLSDLDSAQAALSNKSIRLMFGRLIIYALLQFSGNEAMEMADGKKNLVPRHIKRAEDYIKANLAEPLDNDLLAKVAQVSPRSLYRGFVQFRGVTPARYIQELRLDEAHRMLTAEDRSLDISRIAELAGFRSYASFWRSYVRKFGTPPSKSRPPSPREDLSDS